MGFHHLFSCFRRGQKTSFPENATVDEVSEEQRRGGAVLVELFSSQGCKTSPEAEELVGRLARGEINEQVPPLVVLDFHVDYWDYLGWKDPLASSLWTVRQKAYVEALRLDALYTPLLVVHGNSHCLGTDQDALLSAVQSAPRFPTPAFQASFHRPSVDTLQVSLSGALRTKVDGDGADVMVALYERGAMTECTKGENRGRRLSNDYAVRGLDKVSSVKDISAKKTVTGTVSFPLWEGFKSSGCGVLLFVQNASSLRTLGVQQLDLPHNV